MAQSGKSPELPASLDYWIQSRRPLVSLAFIVPLLAIYEGGVLALGPRAMRNGVDVWLRTLLDWIGFGQYFLLPLLTVSLLLAWHHLTCERWQVKPRVLSLMAAECAVLGIALLMIAHAQGRLLHSITTPFAPATMTVADWPGARMFGRLVGFFGAGIYEEVLFRLLMLPAAAAAIKMLGGSPRMCVVGAIAATSLLFSAAHYIGPQGEALQWFSFAFRLLAGGFFAMLFVYRGFGIAAGTHALYDIFAGLW